MANVLRPMQIENDTLWDELWDHREVASYDEVAEARRQDQQCYKIMIEHLEVQPRAASVLRPSRFGMVVKTSYVVSSRPDCH